MVLLRNKQSGIVKMGRSMLTGILETHKKFTLLELSTILVQLSMKQLYLSNVGTWQKCVNQAPKQLSSMEQLKNLPWENLDPLLLLLWQEIKFQPELIHNHIKSYPIFQHKEQTLAGSPFNWVIRSC